MRVSRAGRTASQGKHISGFTKSCYITPWKAVCNPSSLTEGFQSPLIFTNAYHHPGFFFPFCHSNGRKVISPCLTFISVTIKRSSKYFLDHLRFPFCKLPIHILCPARYRASGLFLVHLPAPYIVTILFVCNCSSL